MIPFIETKLGASIFIHGAMHEIDRTNAQFDPIISILQSNSPPADAAQQIEDLLTKSIRLVQSAVASAAGTGITFEHGTVRYDGVEIHNSLTDRLIRMLEEGHNIGPLVAFLKKLMQNPSFRVVNRLYDFLEYGGIPINEDGDFLAWKAIQKDWTDIHSGTMDNSIGQVLQVPRNQVDEDSERTCSYGLHVCSWNYLPNFAHRDGRVILVKVNPADVVAIPSDYNNTKMRTCRYEVVTEYVGYYEKDPQNWLSSKSVYAADAFLPAASDFEEEEEEEEEDFEEGRVYFGHYDGHNFN